MTTGHRAENYALIRDAIEDTYPVDFASFNKRLDTPGGFARPVSARRREWETSTRKANFKLPKALSASFHEGNESTILRLITLRSNDQFNTTIYGYADRLRGIRNSRMIVMMNRRDREKAGIAESASVRITTAADDGILRSMRGFQVIDYDIPRGACAAYFPECNALLPLWQYAEESKTPAAKSIPVRVTAE